ncbi:carbohydrate kinase family protein [Paenibacillus sp. S28]|uniref:carbohydrate kinase family protein n=1 Tax=Paenibacillus sp. S28 TaxID=2767463 RepID=UPI00190C7E9D|nr:carbohydrate kinase family protein [Paenibacillus sp. S28]MBJ9989149.1 carbohydrate kinase family protein [Paenibacillus sp. S28]
MKKVSADFVVAGHICLDVIPEISGLANGLGDLLVPGRLTAIGPALMSTGGAVSNTGLALHRLGFAVQLMGKVGDDLFGKAILDGLSKYSSALTEGMILTPGEISSYTVVISPPGVDRVFLHATGANDTFCAEDIQTDLLEGTKLFHFGYPPLMRRMFENNGKELVRLLSKIKALGATVSLDTAMPDPASAAGRADWRKILTDVLPFVDIFLPSYEEILFMLHPEIYQKMVREYAGKDLLSCADGSMLSSMAEELLGMGAAVVGFKLGEYGLYIRTSNDTERLSAMGACAPSCTVNWMNRELLVPCFQVEAIGTTGAGDCTIAGFLVGVMNRLTIENTMLGAVGVGACNVERADAVSGVRSWRDVLSRIHEGWPQSGQMIPLDGWRILDLQGLRLYEQNHE